MKTFQLFTILTFLMVFSSHCGKSKTSSGMSIIPLALMGGSTNDGYYDPIQSGSSTSVSSQDNVPQLYSVTDSGSACVRGSVEAPSSFGSEGPEAYLDVCSTTNVDRYKSLKIVFSHPMDPSSVESSFSITSNVSGSLPGPSPGGEFIWNSPRVLIFDPYKELKSRETYFINIASTAKTTDNRSLKEFNSEFKSSHDYLISFSITQDGNAFPALSEKDLTFSSGGGNLTLNAEFSSPLGAYDEIYSITFNRIGNTDNNGNPRPTAKTICSGNCSGLGTPIDLNTDSQLQNIDMAITEGGNNYYYEIKTNDGKTFRRFFSFNYGKINQNPNGLITNVASGVLDQTQMMKMLGRLIEVFTQNKFKVNNKTFNDFATGEKSTTPRTPQCYDFRGLDDSNGNPVSISYIRSYGDSGNPNGDGYCNNKFTAEAVLKDPLFGFTIDTANVSMDVYVTSVELAPKTNGKDSVSASLGINQNDELGIDLLSRTVVVGLGVVANFNDSLTIAIPAGKKMYFSTTATLNVSPRNDDLRLARARNTLSVDSNGVMNLSVKTPHTPYDDITQNLYIKGWTNPKDGNCWSNGSYMNGNYDYSRSNCTDNLYVANMVMKGSNSWIADILNAILPSLVSKIANEMVPTVKANITQAMVKDILQKVAPNVLNSIVGTLKDPGVDLSLPSYLPAPLGGYGLNAKVQLSSDAVLRSEGSNKGIVSSIHLAVTSKVPDANPRQHANSGICGGDGCFVYFKDPNSPLVHPANSAPFLESSSRPGFLLALHSDAITQAAYHMWKNRAVDLNIDKTFINSVNSYAGDDPLLKLTDSILQVSAIMSIIAPGRNTLVGVNGNSLLPAICGLDEVIFKMDPIHHPVARMLDSSNYDPVSKANPNINLSFMDLQLTVQGKRTDNSEKCVSSRGAPNGTKYTLATIRVSMNANGYFGFEVFDNPNTPEADNLNALNFKIFTENLKYSMEVLEGNTYNPYGLDPQGIYNVLNPLVKTLVIPMVNSILNKIPLPAEVEFPALNYTNSLTKCKINAKTDNAIKFNSLKPPTSDASFNPYIYSQVELKGDSLTDAKNMLESNCR
ncbi:MAG: Ig-like domain-containing protein [Leptospiraceae bacterium]|nr:Ig-like domain-containing protein [Leptospiraceae bacterium]MCP5513745.1 Ig-like domain-containing protein [Leptospiraceae bacterium]